MLIDLRNITKSYAVGTLQVPVLNGVSLGIEAGEFVALMGSSGSGKTTLMNILGGLDVPSSGQYLFEGQDIAALSNDDLAALRAQRFGFVFQTFNLLPRTSALQNVLMPCTYDPGARADAQLQARAESLLQRMGLEDRLLHEPAQLSGGQQQRVAIARALINQPALLLADEPTGNLDSATSRDVLRIVQQLNAEEGVTIVLVTHEEDVARHARRIVRIQDGRVVADEATSSAFRPVLRRQVTATAPVLPTPLPVRIRRVTTALQGLRRNKLRAALTTLGIVIGIAAVIAMMEVGRGSATAIQKTIASMGAHNLMILPGTASSGGVSFGAGSVMTLTPEDSNAIATEAPSVRAVAPVVRVRAQLVYGDRNWVPISIVGTTPSYLDVRDWSLVAGEPFSDRDVRNGNKVCLIGQRLVQELFAGEDPLGKELRVQSVPFTVVGVLAAKGANMMGMDQDDVLVAPWTTIKARIASAATGAGNTPVTPPTPGPEKRGQIYPSNTGSLYPTREEDPGGTSHLVRFANVDQIIAAALGPAAVGPAIDQITDILHARHKIRPGEQDDFGVRDMAEMSKVVTSTAGVMTQLLLAVSLISLVVGGVGIMNIMLVSVTERTREIGLRMAVGARRRDIQIQFLQESVLLCLLGGLVGILCGRGISTVIRSLLQWPIELSWDAIITAFVVSVTVGLVFGFYPAWKASRQNPIVALRYE